LHHAPVLSSKERF